MTELKGKVNQVNPLILNDGDDEQVHLSKLGQVFTADWKMRLLLAGRCWGYSLGAISADGATTAITGGGAGTVADIEQPEIIFGVDEGFHLVCLECDITVESDADAPDDFMEIMLYGDRTQAPPTSLTGTVVTPFNLLDGAGAFPGRAYKEVTADIVDPVLSELFMYRRSIVKAVVMQGTSANEDDAIDTQLMMHYEPALPSFLKGPCSVVVSWAGTVATTGLATIKFAAIPSSWVPQV